MLLQDAKAGTVPADPLMQALLDQYLKRLSVNRATLTALFKAADSRGEGLLDRPQAKAALTCADSGVSDTSVTTIWLEREKVGRSPPPAPVSCLLASARSSVRRPDTEQQQGPTDCTCPGKHTNGAEFIAGSMAISCCLCTVQRLYVLVEYMLILQP